jgi:hypothetical protein
MLLKTRVTIGGKIVDNRKFMDNSYVVKSQV